MNNKLEDILEILKTLTLTETTELIKKIEETFNVDSNSQTLPLNFLGNIGNISTPQAEVKTVVEEKTTFDIILEEVPGDKKIAILKIVRSVTGLGLKESKDIVDNTPKILKESLSKDEAESIKKDLENAGAKVLLK